MLASPQHFKSKALIVWLTLALIVPSVHSASNRHDQLAPPHRHFSKAEIGENLPLESVSFDKIGRLLLLSQKNLSVYDGLSWNRIEASETQDPFDYRKLSFDPDGNIYALGIGDLKKLNFSGGHRFQLQSAQLDEAVKRFDNQAIEGVFTHEGTTFLFSKTKLVAQFPNQATFTWPPLSYIVTLLVHQDHIYLIDRQQGLFRVQDKSLQQIPNSNSLALTCCTHSPKGNLLLGSHKNGLFEFDGTTLFPWNSNQIPLSGETITSLAYIDENTLAVVASQKGLKLIDENKRIIREYNDALHQNLRRAHTIATNKDGVVWALSRSGLDRIDLDSDYSYLSPLFTDTLESPTLAQENDVIWLTSQGNLYRSLKNTSGAIERFGQVIIASGAKINAVTSTPHGVLCISDDFLYQKSQDDDRFQRVAQGGGAFLQALTLSPNLLILASDSSLRLLERQGSSWNPKRVAFKLSSKPVKVVEQSADTIWIQFDSHKVGRLTLKEENSQLDILNRSHGLPSSLQKIWKYDDRTYFSNSHGIFEFDSINHRFQWLENPPLALSANLSRSIDIHSSQNGLIWASSPIGNYKTSSSFAENNSPIENLKQVAIHSIQDHEDGTSWIIADSEIVRYQPNRLGPEAPDASTYFDYIRVLNTGQLIHSIHTAPSDEPSILPYRNNSIELRVTTPALSSDNDIHHEILLDGFSDDWLKLDEPNHFSITNLDRGHYQLTARAVSNGKEISRSETLFFSVKPPFYKTAVALLFYAILLIVFVFIGALWISRKTKHENLHLTQLVEERTEELKHINDQLQVSARNADSANKAKSSFLASMSHEIRTPLNGVIGMTSLLKQTNLNKDQKELVHVIETSGESVVAIVNDILDYSKIEAGKIELESTKFGLRECIEQALDIFIEQVSKKNLELAYYIDDDVPLFLEGDSTRLRQILVNLIGNAVKFTSKGYIYLSVSCNQIIDDNASLKFKIEDTGIGIAENSLKLLFKSFSQIQPQQTPQNVGSGLGLAISKKLVELMGGQIEVKSVIDQGSTFTFDIAIAYESIEAKKYATDQLAGKTVLLIEDSDIQRRVLQKYCQNWGIQTLDASNPTDALTICENSEAPIDIAVIDQRLPSITGNELARQLREIESCKRATFISITASSIENPSNIFNIALTKPIKPNYLFESLERCLKSSPRNDPSPTTSEPTLGEDIIADSIPLSILLVDDNDTNRQVARMLLQKLGYSAEEAINGQEAVDLSAKTHFDVILMDVQMPVMDGKVATEKIRELDHVDEPWIVAVTAGAMRGDMENALRSGMDDYVSKPILLDTLKGALVRASEGIKMRSRSV